MRHLALSAAIVLLPSPGLAQTVVLDAKPTVKAVSGDRSTERHVLSDAEQTESRVLIVKRNGRYFWVSREDRELIRHRSGAFHFFIEPRGGGYVKVFDTTLLPESLRDPGPRYRYMEHLTLWLGTVTYWGSADEFNVD